LARLWTRVWSPGRLAFVKSFDVKLLHVEGTSLDERNLIPMAEKATTEKAAPTCHYGGGSYGSPKDSKRCKNPMEPKRQLCAKHELAWKVESKRRAAERKAAQPAKPKAEPKAKAAKVESVNIAAIRDQPRQASLERVNRRIASLEDEGLTTSDAQGVLMADEAAFSEVTVPQVPAALVEKRPAAKAPKP
jgi:hypothetical protein